MGSSVSWAAPIAASRSYDGRIPRNRHATASSSHRSRKRRFPRCVLVSRGGRPGAPLPSARMRLIVARCAVDYTGRLTAHLPEALRLIVVKADGSVLVHADAGGYKPLNWMTPPTVRSEERRVGKECRSRWSPYH